MAPLLLQERGDCTLRSLYTIFQKHPSYLMCWFLPIMILARGRLCKLLVVGLIDGQDMCRRQKINDTAYFEKMLYDQPLVTFSSILSGFTHDLQHYWFFTTLETEQIDLWEYKTFWPLMMTEKDFCTREAYIYHQVLQIAMRHELFVKYPIAMSIISASTPAKDSWVKWKAIQLQRSFTLTHQSFYRLLVNYFLQFEGGWQKNAHGR